MSISQIKAECTMHCIAFCPYVLLSVVLVRLLPPYTITMQLLLLSRQKGFAIEYYRLISNIESGGDKTILVLELIFVYELQVRLL